MSAKVLQKILGHSKIQTTLDTYCDVFDEYEKKHNDLTFKYLQDNNLTLSSVQ
jgi:site-specific recombinase XerD